MVQTLIKSKKVKEMARTDIVFCIDLSGSMTPCIEGVKENIHNFIDNIENDPDIKIDWRLGILGHSADDNRLYFRKKDFTDQISMYQSVINRINNDVKGWNESNMQALDWSLDFDWRSGSHKFVILFTDEDIDGGWNPSLSHSLLSELITKIGDLGISVFAVTVGSENYSEYRKIGATDKCSHISISGNDFGNVEFDELLVKLGKSVSSSSRGLVSKQKIVKKDIYEVNSITTLDKL